MRFIVIALIAVLSSTAFAALKSLETRLVDRSRAAQCKTVEDVGQYPLGLLRLKAVDIKLNPSSAVTVDFDLQFLTCEKVLKNVVDFQPASPYQSIQLPNQFDLGASPKIVGYQTTSARVFAYQTIFNKAGTKTNRVFGEIPAENKAEQKLTLELPVTTATIEALNQGQTLSGEFTVYLLKDGVYVLEDGSTEPARPYRYGSYKIRFQLSSDPQGDFQTEILEIAKHK